MFAGLDGGVPTPARLAVFEALADALPSPAALGHPARVAIDGPSGAGKTVFREELAAVLRLRGSSGPSATAVIEASLDDFHHMRAVRYAQGRDSAVGCWEDAFNYPVIIAHLLTPLGPGGDLRYRAKAHDLVSDVALADEPWQTAERDAILVVDGVFAQRAELAPLWDFAIYLDVSMADAQRRLAVRDGAHPDPEHPVNARYTGAQSLYVQACDPKNAADAVVDNVDPAAPRVVRLGPGPTILAR